MMLQETATTSKACAPDSEQALEMAIYGLRVTVSSSDSDLLSWVRSVFSSTFLPSTVQPYSNGVTVEYKVHIADDSSVDGLHSVSRGGTVVVQTHSRGEMQSCLERAITLDAAKHLGTNYLIHAGAVALKGRGVLLPASSGSGKSTLVAALALCGFDYYSDEVAVITAQGRLLPFSKAISLKPGGWQTISSSFPYDALEAASLPPYVVEVHHLKPPRLPSFSPEDGGCDVELVVLPSYVPGADPSIQPIPKSRALDRLVRESLNLSLLGRDGFDILFNLVQHARCYSLVTGDLTRAVMLLEGLMNDPA